MGENITELEYQSLSPSQKEAFIRKKLAQYSGDFSETRYKELEIRLLHPEVLTWEGSQNPSRLPPQEGKIIGLSPDISGGKRNRSKFIIVDFTSSTPVTGVSYAQFSMKAVEVNQRGEMIIDCSKLESLKSGIQAIFPHNTFVERVNFTPTLKHNPTS